MTSSRDAALRSSARRRFGRALTVAAMLGAALGLATPAYSYWTASSMGSAATAAATLPAPTLTASSVTAASATLTWTRPFAPTGYDLSQSPGNLTGCPEKPVISSAGCTASGLTPNTSYTFSLSASLHNWRSPATATVITPKQATTTTISDTTPQSALAGTTFAATAKVTGYGTPAGTITFGLYPTSDCSGPASYTTPAQPVTGGSATGTLQPIVGTYSWQATYTPTDSYNDTSTSTCSDPIKATRASGGIYHGIGQPKVMHGNLGDVFVQYPAGTSEGDLVLLVLVDTYHGDHKHAPYVPSSSPGWKEIPDGTTTGKEHMGFQTWWHTVGSASESSVEIEHDHGGQLEPGATAWVITYKNMPNAAIDGSSFSTATSKSPVTAPPLATNRPDATVISLVGTDRSDLLSLSTDRNFVFRTSQGVPDPADHALGVADRFVPSPETIPPPMWQGPSQSSQWAFTTVAFTTTR